jgi:hypothetical protein
MHKNAECVLPASGVDWCYIAFTLIDPVDRAAAGADGMADAGQVRVGIGLQRVELGEGEVLQEWGRTWGNLCCLGADRRPLGALQMKVISQRCEQAGWVYNRCRS